MANEYEEEFSREIDLIEFHDWLRRCNTTFYYNMGKYNRSDKKSLREWVHTFLLWTEYEENK